MEEPTDEDFLAALADPRIYQLATQEAPGSGAMLCSQPRMTLEQMSEMTSDGSHSQPKTEDNLPIKPGEKGEGKSSILITSTPGTQSHCRPTNPSDYLSPQAVLAAQRRRQATIAEIEQALHQWKPTLREAFAEDAHAEMGKRPAPSSITKEDLDKLKRNADVTIQKDEELDRYQAEAITAALEGKSFFLTGSAGTGKSYVLKKIIKKLRKIGKKVAVTASTGCAAVGIGGGTVHSFTGVGIGMDPIDRLRSKARTNENLRRRFLNLHTLVIDEISMIDTFLFDKIEAVVHTARCPPPRKGKGEVNGPRSRSGRIIQGDGAPFRDEPFGGLQVIVCGDFFQLPPVAASDYKYRKSSEKFFAFDSSAWQMTIKMIIVLRVVHRQADRKFVGLLNEIRQGVVSDRTKQVINACIVNPSKALIEADEQGKRVTYTKLFSYRRQVASENSTQLKRLKTKAIRYVASDTIHRSELGTLTIGIVQQMLENINCPESVELRIGSRVLCLKNVDTMRGIVNGASGTLVGWSTSLAEIYRKRKKANSHLKWNDVEPHSLHDNEVMDDENPDLTQLFQDSVRDENDCPVFRGAERCNVLPVVQFDNGVRRLMGCESWEVVGMRGQVVAVRCQAPLMLGWALSIHKAQGMTLGDVETDVGGAFDFGQVYVALSRATTVHRLRLKSFKAEKVVTHYKVTNFYRDLEKRNLSPRKRLSCGCEVGECTGTHCGKS